MTWRLWASVALMAGCGTVGDDAQRVAVREHNELGITAIETASFADDGDKVFELRALDANDDERGLVRLRSGEIEDIREWLPGDDDVGSEIIVSVAGDETRMVTREQQRFQLGDIGNDATQQFLALDTVAATLASEANVLVPLPDEHADVDEVPYYVSGCSASYLLTSPVAGGCCYGNLSNWGTKRYTTFINPMNQIVQREQGNACRAADGVSACSGASCYFGPNGFARPIVTAQSGYPGIVRRFDDRTGGSWCQVYWYSSPQASTYPDVTGTFPRGQGCPGGGSTGAGEWDY